MSLFGNFSSAICSFFTFSKQHSSCHLYYLLNESYLTQIKTTALFSYKKVFSHQTSDKSLFRIDMVTKKYNSAGCLILILLKFNIDQNFQRYAKYA